MFSSETFLIIPLYKLSFLSANQRVSFCNIFFNQTNPRCKQHIVFIAFNMLAHAMHEGEGNVANQVQLAVKLFQSRCVQRQKIRNKKVLLVANSTVLREEAVRHGLNLSKRMNASLEILHLLHQESPKNVAKSFQEIMTKLNPEEPVGYIPLLNHRGVTTETVDYARNRRNILCACLCLKGEGPPRAKGKRQERFEKITKQLNCPVVLYTDTPKQQKNRMRET